MLLIVVHREGILLELAKLARGSVLNRVERLAAFLKRGSRVVGARTLLQLRERAFIDTLYELRLDWHIRVLMQDLVCGEQIFLSCHLLLALVDDLTRGIVIDRLVDR